jgi:hypothetical protein
MALGPLARQHITLGDSGGAQSWSPQGWERAPSPTVTLEALPGGLKTSCKAHLLKVPPPPNGPRQEPRL